MQTMKGKEAQKRLGMALRCLRQKRKLTQEKMSELVGISTEAMRAIERGHFSPRFTRLATIASVLNVPLWFIIKIAETTDWTPF